MLKTVIVDDEAPARRRLRKLLEPLEESGRISIVGEAEDGMAALRLLEEKPVDLLFLDIKMPEMNGFDVVERVQEDHRPAVVFTTAFDEFALKAFEANAVDYLLKPISSERLEAAVTRSERAHRSPSGKETRDARVSKLLDWLDAQVEWPTGPVESSDGDYLKQISIPYRDRILIEPVGRLIAAEINEGITRLYVLQEEAASARVRLHPYVVNYTLDQLEASLDPERFMRVHRSSIVQLERIREMIPWFSGRYKIMLEGGHEVIASRSRSKELRDRLSL